MNVVIIGCGRVGAFLAGLLDTAGDTVTIVDVDRAAFLHLPREFTGTTLLGDGTDLDILRQAGAEQADTFVALTQGDNRNIMAAQVASKIFGIKKVIAKVNDPIRAYTYRREGLETFSRTSILATLLQALIGGDTKVGPDLVAAAARHEAAMSGEELPEPA
ncbi:MAG TPA: TrkA family potassium uptake protein [Candidatus Limnocylindria bacterium]